MLYARRTCNEAKQAIIGLPDPCQVAFHNCLRVMADGRIDPLNPDGEKLEQVLRLNSVSNLRNRFRWMRMLAALSVSDQKIYQELMGFPEDLPDLRAKRAPRIHAP